MTDESCDQTSSTADSNRPGDGGGPTGPGRLSSRVIHDGRVVHLAVDRVRFPDGGEGELEVVRHRGASAVVPLLDEPGHPDPRVVLLRQYRYAAGGFLFEIPAGIPEEGEEWQICAGRELTEETGYEAGSLTALTRIFTTPGFTDEVVHLFLATDLKGVGHRRDEDEFIEVCTFPFSRVLEMIRSGEIRDGKSLAALFYVDRFVRREAG